MKNENLAEIFAAVILTAESCTPDFDNTTIDDVYDFLDIPVEYRSDFCTAAILGQMDSYL
jgi:hypothetical protein